MTLVDLLYAVTTGPERRRKLLTPVGLLFAAGLLLLVIFGGFFTDRALALRPLLPGGLGVSIGAGLLAAGLMLWAWCLTLFKGKGVPFDPPSQLVVAGPYAWVRNPMLSGLCLALFGVGFILHSVSMVFLWTPAFVLLNVIELKLVEEPELERRLGAMYREYRERVPMLIPKKPARDGSKGR
ncbi:MAG: isoprenylcysteine carboxylmethyltransferase family protein [Thermoanaerobaculia bacterium]|nr:isoprenylcysteine carboxylmethyltransferase family protein [Thermoanaerobaculia bacterium]